MFKNFKPNQPAMKIFFLLLLFFIFTSCQQKEKAPLTKVWLFAEVDFPDEKVKTDLADAAISLNFTSESFLNIQKDGKFTSYFGRYVQGTWKEKNDKIYLSDPDDNSIAFEIKELND